MPKVLSDDAVARYRHDGILFPLEALSAGEVAEARRRLDALHAREGGAVSKATNQKPHLLLPWLADMVRHPRVLDAVEDVIGPDILCWGAGFFAKRGPDASFVSWHQDSTYWGLSSPDVVTAWIAFTESTPANGCMRVIPGTHLQDQLPHADTFAADNLLSRGQEIAVAVDPADAVDVTLEAGQFSLHHVRLVHGSEPNPSSRPRIGFAVRYIPTYVRQVSGFRDSASLVRGTDRHGHFDPEPVPAAEFHPDAVAYHRAMIERHTEILYRGAAQRPRFDSAGASGM